MPNSGSYELCYPERDNTIVGNIVHDNMQPDTPAIDVALLAMGNGILVAGGNRNMIERNLVYDHERIGIGLVPFPEEEANDGVPDPSTWDTPCAEVRDDPPAVTDPDALAPRALGPGARTRVVGNDVSGSGLADLALGSLQPDLAELDNCFATTRSPPRRRSTSRPWPPARASHRRTTGTSAPLDLGALVGAERPPSVDYETAPTPEPPDQPNMPDADTAPAAPGHRRALRRRPRRHRRARPARPE